MRKSLLVLSFIFFMCLAGAQVEISINGQITNNNIEETIYISGGAILRPLELSDEGNFSITLKYDKLPSYFTFETIKGSRINALTPRIWFEKEAITVKVNLADNTFETSSSLPYQELSEEIEAASKKKKIELILNNTHQTPSVYYADKLKTEIPINDLEQFLNDIHEHHNISVYTQRIKSYLEAKKRSAIKKGQAVMDFKLPDKSDSKISVINGSSKTKLIVFLSTGCSYSIASIDLLAQINKLNKDQIEIISIWKDSSKNTWLNTLKDEKEKITWTNLWDQYEFATTYFDNDFTPQYFVVDAEGVLIDKFRGYSKKTAKKLSALIDKS